jgi:ABC-type dipeptide/oligopeptide/nickel transport system ATPase component
MWQSLGVLFGNNLKTKYDPSKGEDKLIEEIILQIQDGEV